MKIDNILKHLEGLLNAEGMDASLISSDDESPQDRILVFLGNDQQGREQILEITAQDQELGQSLKGEISQDEPHLARVQFQVLLPFQLKAAASKDVAGLLCYLNRQMELPGLEMNEVDDSLFYRHVLLTTHENLNKTLVVSIVGIIMFILKLYSELIEKVASGKMTFNNVLEKVVEASHFLDQQQDSSS